MSYIGDLAAVVKKLLTPRNVSPEEMADAEFDGPLNRYRKFMSNPRRLDGPLPKKIMEWTSWILNEAHGDKRQLERICDVIIETSPLRFGARTGEYSSVGTILRTYRFSALYYTFFDLIGRVASELQRHPDVYQKLIAGVVNKIPEIQDASTSRDKMEMFSEHMGKFLAREILESEDPLIQQICLRGMIDHIPAWVPDVNSLRLAEKIAAWPAEARNGLGAHIARAIGEWPTETVFIEGSSRSLMPIGDRAILAYMAIANQDPESPFMPGKLVQGQYMGLLPQFAPGPHVAAVTPAGAVLYAGGEYTQATFAQFVPEDRRAEYAKCMETLTGLWQPRPGLHSAVCTAYGIGNPERGGPQDRAAAAPTPA